MSGQRDPVCTAVVLEVSGVEYCVRSGDGSCCNVGIL